MLIIVQLPAHACGNTFSGEPDAGKSACPVRRGESGPHRKVSPPLLLYRLSGEHLVFRRSTREEAERAEGKWPQLGIDAASFVAGETPGRRVLRP